MHLNNDVIPLWKERSLTWRCSSLGWFVYMYSLPVAGLYATTAGTVPIRTGLSFHCGGVLGFLIFFKFFLRFCERAKAVNLLLFYFQMKSQSFPNPVSWQ